MGGGGNDVLRGQAGNDIIYGLQGGDVIYTGSGDDYVTGDGGDDTVVYDGDREDYKVQYWEHPDLGPYVTVSDMVGNGGIDTLFTVERIIFNNDVIFL